MIAKLVMSEEDKYGLQPLWEALYDVYSEFAKVCDKHGLRYYALGGTLLGAIRHNGFIPWDDDLDVAMPRPDYERFIELSKEELPLHLKFVNWKNTPEFPFLYGKLQESREEKVYALEAKMGHELQNGVFIDIFPLDGYPGYTKRIWLKIKGRLMAYLAIYRNGRGQKTIKTMMQYILGCITSMFFTNVKTKKDFMTIYEQDLRSCDYEKSEWVADVSLAHNLFRFPPQLRSSWGNPRVHSFNGACMMIPNSPDDSLRSRYGKNYMRLPPKNNRHPSHSWGERRPWCFGPTNPIDSVEQ